MHADHAIAMSRCVPRIALYGYMTVPSCTRIGRCVVQGGVPHMYLPSFMPWISTLGGIPRFLGIYPEFLGIPIGVYREISVYRSRYQHVPGIALHNLFPCNGSGFERMICLYYWNYSSFLNTHTTYLCSWGVVEVVKHISVSCSEFTNSCSHCLINPTI